METKIIEPFMFNEYVFNSFTLALVIVDASRMYLYCHVIEVERTLAGLISYGT